MSVQSFLAPITGQTAVIDLPDAENWMQGRTLYGGASALIAYTHAIRAFTDLPPLRAAQVGFVAPVGGRVELQAEIVRQGRSVTQLRSELYQDGALALTAFFLFAEPRKPNALYPTRKPSDFPPPAEESEDVMSDKGPSFLRNNFEIRRAQNVSGPGEPVVRRWARSRIAKNWILSASSSCWAMYCLLVRCGRCSGRARSVQSTGHSICWKPIRRLKMAGGCRRTPVSTPTMGIHLNACGFGTAKVSRLSTVCNRLRSSDKSSPPS